MILALRLRSTKVKSVLSCVTTIKVTYGEFPVKGLLSVLHQAADSFSLSQNQWCSILTGEKGSFCTFYNFFPPRMLPQLAMASTSPIEQFLYRRVLNSTSTDDISLSSLLQLRLELVTCLTVSWTLLYLARRAYLHHIGFFIMKEERMFAERCVPF